GRTTENIEALDVLLYDGTRMHVAPLQPDALADVLEGTNREATIYRALLDLRDRYADEIRARYPRIPRRVSGYNLDQLLPENGFNVAKALVGSECTCAVTLKAWCKLVPNPQVKSLVAIGFPDVGSAGDCVARALEFHPIAIEGLDSTFLVDVR